MEQEVEEIMSNVNEKIKSIDMGKIIFIGIIVLIAIFFVLKDLEYVNKKGDFKLENSQVFVLDESNELYNKIQVNDSKEKLLNLMEDSQKVEVTIIDSDNNFYYNYLVEDGVIKRVRRDIFSSGYQNIQLSTELETEIENLKIVIGNVKEGMTLEEVEKILGNKYFERQKTSEGEIHYTWYDKLENSVDICFDEEGKVYYIGSIYGDL